ncbi:hypothetical protein B0T17DRAFT_381315 [Bombardia bombarda]|uniref:MalT-like TPR region domain-containing protein n=1 Tax=Bombardia bombarda TaxID=252184 RepID=A0AA39WGZ5_9PEZI|nr:hypothetical protein B0T17DRAFT_381315 [Bombardia bombarda]
MEMCLKEYQSWGTEKEMPSQYSKYNHHTSFGLMAEGRVAEALGRVAKGVELQLLHAGEAGIMHIAYKCRHGLLLYHAGQVERALAVLDECIAAYKTALGDSNAQTLDTYCFAAGILLERGKELGKAR